MAPIKVLCSDAMVVAPAAAPISAPAGITALLIVLQATSPTGVSSTSTADIEAAVPAWHQQAYFPS